MMVCMNTCEKLRHSYWLFPTDLQPGMKIRLMELQNTNSHDAWKKVTPEEKKMMVKALEEWHKAKVTGVRTQGLTEMGDV